MGDSTVFSSNGTFADGESGTCEPGLILPFIPHESSWSTPVRATLYCCGLIYCFMGLAIAADMFMGSIEKITSKTKKIYIPRGEHGGDVEVIEVKIWNDTVANLTLMALGSSAPEILLSCIEIAGNDFQVGALGPGSIVGSAAFNLLIICATCIMAIPNGETRKIKKLNVFLITTGFSMFAYIWLLVILKFASTDVVEVWEALLTFLFFPILVLIAWIADRSWTRRNKLTSINADQVANQDHGLGNEKNADALFVKNYGSISNPITNGRSLTNMEINSGQSKTMIATKDKEVNADDVMEVYKGLRRFPHLSDKEAAILVAKTLMDNQAQSRSHLWYRIKAIRSLTGGKRIHPALSEKLRTVYDTIKTTPEVGPVSSDPSQTCPCPKSVVEFHAACYAVPENIGKFKVTVIRTGRMENTVRVRVESFDGTAKAGVDYVKVNEQLVFGPYTKEREIAVTIIDDNQWEPDETFFLRLSFVDEGIYNRHDACLGRLPITEIVILNDDEAGLVSFRKKGVLVRESCKFACIDVERTRGADGEISVQWKTIDDSATSPKDYEGGQGTLIFKHGETLRTIEVPIMEDIQQQDEKRFKIELMNPDGGAELGKITKMAVTICNDENFNCVLQKMMMATSHSIKSMQAHHESWKVQIQTALTVNGGDIENATNFDYIMHFLTFGWKAIFSLIPPPEYCGGWLCFFCSLAGIGVLTAVVGDLASIFGCLINLKDSVTAITFVTVGTSLPDLFASRNAARTDKKADNAVGNFTGSNSVNVFLGLGLPWLIAAIYHQVNGSVFKVPSGSIGFSVAVYSVVAFAAFVMILLRRFSSFFGKAELGGPSIPKYMSGVYLITLWFIFLVLLSLQAYHFI